MIDKNSEISRTTLGLKLLCNNEKNNKDVFEGRVPTTNIQTYSRS
jgi:hypothetical protein